MTDALPGPHWQMPDCKHDLELAKLTRDANRAGMTLRLIVAAWTAALLMPACAASPTLAKPAFALHANPAEQTDDGSSSIPEPELNPSPEKVIRIFGRAPKNLDFRFRAVWEVGKREQGCVVDLPFWEGGGDRAHGLDIPIKRRGERYEAELVVDHYSPGHCEWHFTGAGITVERSGRLEDSDTNGVIHTNYMFVDDNLPRCLPYMKNCDEARSRLVSNAEDIPVQVRCGTAPPDRRSRNWSDFECNWTLEFDYKESHQMKPDTSWIQIDVYDLDVESPPSPLYQTRKITP